MSFKSLEELLDKRNKLRASINAYNLALIHLNGPVVATICTNPERMTYMRIEGADYPAAVAEIQGVFNRHHDRLVADLQRVEYKLAQVAQALRL